MRTIYIWGLVIGILSIWPTATLGYGSDGLGQAFYDLGIFAFETGNYMEAEKQFRMALEAEPDHPLYNQYLGKTLMKSQRFSEAKTCLVRAYKKDPTIPDIEFDIAVVNYQLHEYEASRLMLETIVQKQPDHPAALFYLGMCKFRQQRYKEAMPHFERAANLSPALKPDAAFYLGICQLNTGNPQKAMDHFQYVVDHTPSAEKKQFAAKWLAAIRKKQASAIPFSIYAKIGCQYDDNVRLEPLDDEDRYSDESDIVGKGYFSGTWHLMRQSDFRVGIGYNHYQTWHDDLNEYDLIGSIGLAYLKYRWQQLIFGVQYLPAYYWLESDSFLLRHEIRPELTWQLAPSVTTRFTYNYYRDIYFTQYDNDGTRHSGNVDVYYFFDNSDNYIFAGGGYETNATRHPDNDYGQWQVRAGLSMGLFWRFQFRLNGFYWERDYDHEDSQAGFQRKDVKYRFAAAVSRPLFIEEFRWVVETDFTKNDSNFMDYDYERFTATFSLELRY